MPLIFTILGFAIVYSLFAPLINVGVSVANMVIADHVPNFQDNDSSVYKQSSALSGTISSSEIEFPKYGDHYANLSCERIGLDVKVYWGDTPAILKKGPGHDIRSMLPGFGSPILLSAHNTTHFYPLKDVKEGDIIKYSTSYGEYLYRVTGTKVANENDMDATRLRSNEEVLVMYTCYPFEVLTVRKTERFFVYAQRISGPDVSYMEGE